MAIYLGNKQLDGGGGGGGVLMNQYASFIIQDGTRDGIPATNGYSPATGIYTTEDKTYLRTGTRIVESQASFADYPDATITNYERSIVSAISQSTVIDQFWIINNSLYTANSGIVGNKRATGGVGIVERYDFNSSTGKFGTSPAARTLVACGNALNSTYANASYPLSGLGQYYGINWFHYHPYNDRFYIGIYDGNNSTVAGKLSILSVPSSNLIDNSSAISAAGGATASLIAIMTSNRDAGMWDNALNTTNTSGSYDIANVVTVGTNFANAVGDYSDRNRAEAVGQASDNSIHFIFGSPSRKVIMKTPVPDANGHLGTSAGVTRVAYLANNYFPVSRVYDWTDNSFAYYFTVTNPDATIDLKRRVRAYTDNTLSTFSSDTDTTILENLGGTSNILTPRSWGKISSIFGSSEHLWTSQGGTVNRGSFEIQAHIGDPTIREVVDTNLSPAPISAENDALFTSTDAITVSGTTNPNREISIALANPGTFGVDDTLTLVDSNGNIHKGVITVINASGSNPTVITVDFSGSPNGFPVESLNSSDWESVSVTDRLGEFNAMVPTVFIRIK
jgi:hypothetical protein